MVVVEGLVATITVEVMMLVMSLVGGDSDCGFHSPSTNLFH